MRWALFCGLLFGLLCHVCLADGGRLRFSKVAGPFVVTLFTTPEPLTAGPADFSVMVQDAVSGDVLSDAAVRMHFRTDDGQTIEALANRKAATNRLLQAAEVDLPRTGVLHVTLNVSRQRETAECVTDVTVERGSRRAGIVWMFALLPVLAVLLFVVHQRQKASLQRRHVTG